MAKNNIPSADVEVGPNPEVGKDLVPVQAQKPVEVTATAEEHTAIDTSVRTKIASYLAGKTEAHLAVIEGVMWAAKYGDAHYVNVAYDLLGGFIEKPTADAQNLRIWCGRVSTYTGADGKDAMWLGFNSKASATKKAGFFVKHGSAPLAARNDMDATVLKQGPRFMDRVAQSGTAYTMERLLAEIVKMNEAINKKQTKALETEQDKGTPLPASMIAELTKLSADAAVELATRQAVKSSMN